MGPWQHVGAESHVAGDVDFGVSALISGNLAPSVPALQRQWFDRFATSAATVTPPTTISRVNSGSRKDDVADGVRAEAVASALDASSSAADADHLPPIHSRAHSTSPAALVQSISMDQLAHGPAVYIPPSIIPKERKEEDGPLPPAVRYFRMGGGDGHKTSQGCMFHGGMWMAANTWPPVGTEYANFYFGQRSLTRGLYDQPSDAADAPISPSSSSYTFTPHIPPADITSSSANVSVYDYNPRNPCPSIGGNVFGHRDVLLAGAFNQVERPGLFNCKPPYLPLSSRGDVVVFRSGVLKEKLDVTGMPVVKLIISSSAVDTDFTAKLIDEYPPSTDYPAGYAMQVTHGIRRCRFRNSRTKAELLTPHTAYEITIELYPTSNLFAAGHRIRLDISSSNFPHFDLNLNTGEDFESQRIVVAQNRSEREERGARTRAH